MAIRQKQSGVFDFFFPRYFAIRPPFDTEAEGGCVVKEIGKERNFQAEKKPNFVFMSYGHYWSFLV